MATRRRFVSIARAHSQTEGIRIRMLLDRTQIPYQVRGELLHSMGLAGASALGPMDFLVSEELQEAAEGALEELFGIHTDEFPSHCPACNAPTQRERLECPACGLYLA